MDVLSNRGKCTPVPKPAPTYSNGLGGEIRATVSSKPAVSTTAPTKCRSTLPAPSPATAVTAPMRYESHVRASWCPLHHSRRADVKQVRPSPAFSEDPILGLISGPTSGHRLIGRLNGGHQLQRRRPAPATTEPGPSAPGGLPTRFWFHELRAARAAPWRPGPTSPSGPRRRKQKADRSQPRGEKGSQAGDCSGKRRSLSPSRLHETAPIDRTAHRFHRQESTSRRGPRSAWIARRRARGSSY